jgi:hypothetical protein
MLGLIVGDDTEWEFIKKDFVKSGVFSKNRIIAIQRLAKDCAVAMDDAEEIVDRWGKECNEEIWKLRESFTIGDVVRGNAQKNLVRGNINTDKV